MSVAYLWQALIIDMPGRVLVVSPRAFPTFVGVLMVAVSLVVAAKELQSGMRLADATAPVAADPSDRLELGGDEEEPDEDAITSWRDLAVVLVAFLLYVVLFEPVGFLLTTLAFLLVLSSYFAPRRWLRNAVVCVLFTFATAYVFAGLLAVDLPAGLLGVDF